MLLTRQLVLCLIKYFITMTNVAYDIKGNILTIKIDISQKGETSTSGKSVVIASTKGNKQIDAKTGLVLGLNLYKPAK